MTSVIALRDSVVVKRPPEAVFAFVSDHENLPSWTVGVLRARRISHGPPGLGAAYAVVGKGPTGEVDGTYRVTAWVANQRFEGHFESKVFEFHETYTFQRAGDSTRVELSAELQPRGYFRLLSWLMRFAFARQVRQDHAKLKALLEK